MGLLLFEQLNPTGTNLCFIAATFYLPLKGSSAFFAFCHFYDRRVKNLSPPFLFFWRGRKLICFNGNEREVSSGGAVSKSQERRRIQRHSGMGFGRRDPKILLGGRRNRQCSILLARKRSLRKLLLQCKTGNTLIQGRSNIFTHFWGIGIPPEQNHFWGAGNQWKSCQEQSAKEGDFPAKWRGISQFRVWWCGKETRDIPFMEQVVVVLEKAKSEHDPRKHQGGGYPTAAG